MVLGFCSRSFYQVFAPAQRAHLFLVMINSSLFAIFLLSIR
jgi:hypothetical protein